MPRVLHVINDLRYGGAQTQLRLLLSAARERGGPTPWVASRLRPEDGATQPLPNGVPVVWLRGRFTIDPFAAWGLWNLVRRERPEVLQSWDADSAALCRSVRRVTSIPWFHTLHDGLPTEARGADHAIVRDADQRAAVASIVGADRVAVVPNAFDPAIRTRTGGNARVAARQRLRDAGVDLTDESPVLVVAARIDQPSAVRELAWTADLVRIVCPGLRVLIAGGGPAHLACERFSAAATETGLNVFLGPWRDLEQLYAAADVAWCGAGLSPTPTPALEAMAHGLPVVLAAAPGREGLLTAEPGEPPCCLRWDDRAAWARVTKRLLTDKPLAEAIGRRNAACARGRHTLERVSTACEEVMRSVLPA